MDPLLEEPDSAFTEEFAVRLQQISPLMCPVVNKLWCFGKCVNEFFAFGFRGSGISPGSSAPVRVLAGGLSDRNRCDVQILHLCKAQQAEFSSASVYCVRAYQYSYTQGFEPIYTRSCRP